MANWCVDSPYIFKLTYKHKHARVHCIPSRTSKKSENPLFCFFFIVLLLREIEFILLCDMQIFLEFIRFYPILTLERMRGKCTHFLTN